MGRITVELDESLFHAAKGVLGTDTKVATINAALREVVRRHRVEEAVAVINGIKMDFSESERSFGRYGGGRDLSGLDEKARVYADELAAGTARQQPA